MKKRSLEREEMGHPHYGMSSGKGMTKGVTNSPEVVVIQKKGSVNSPDMVVSGKVLGHGNIQTIKL